MPLARDRYAGFESDPVLRAAATLASDVGDKSFGGIEDLGVGQRAIDGVAEVVGPAIVGLLGRGHRVEGLAASV